MTFYDVPLLVESNPQDNATDLLLERVKKSPQHALFSRQNPDKTWRDVTASDFLGEVRTLAKGLIASGIKPGQAVAIMSKTRYEWSMIDFAIWFAGAVTVPIYESSSPSQIEWILSDSDSVALFIENDEHLERVNQIRANAPRVSQIWKIDSAEFTILTVVYLLQAIPMALLRYTKLAFFKTCYLISQVLGLVTELPGLSYMYGSAIYGGFIEFFNEAAGFICLLVILVHICLFFYVKGTPIKILIADRAPKQQ